MARSTGRSQPDQHRSEPRVSRPDLGLILASIHQGSSVFLLPGVMDEAVREDVNLWCFPGGQLNLADEYERQRNAVYRLAGPAFLDGLISWASSLGGTVDQEAIDAFHDHWLAYPLVTIGYRVEGAPAVIVDAPGGMTAIVSHLIEVHGCRAIAFMRGPRTHVSADRRYHAYLETLTRHGIKIDERLVTDPLPWEGGEEGVRQLLDERKLLPAKDFQALVAASDLLAFGAVRSLQRRGYRIPEDLAATGFNDITESRLLSPALTTVSMHFREQGAQAFRLLSARLRKTEPVHDVCLPTTLVVRQSCGCPSERILLAAGSGAAVHAASDIRSEERGGAAEGGPLPSVPESAGDRTIPLAKRLAIEALPLLGDPDPQAESALVSLAAEFVGASGSGSDRTFLGLLDRELERAVHLNESVSAWQDVVSVFRRRTRELCGGAAVARIDDLCSQARVMIAEALERSLTLRSYSAAQRDRQLRELGRQLLMTLELRRLGEVLEQHLPRLGIPSAYVAVYSDSWDRPEYARLVVGFTEAGRVVDPDDPPVVPVRDVIPRMYLPRDRRYSYTVLPLFHQDQQLGYAVLELTVPDGAVYEELRTYLSSSLKSALMFGQTRQALEAAEQADRLKSRLLANVSHELRAPLTAILRYVGSSLRSNPDRGEIPPALRETLYHIQRNAERQLQVTNDLLDYARAEIDQLKLSISIIDPRPVLEHEFAAVAAANAAGRTVSWELDLPDRLPTVSADPARLAQIVRNLLVNAAKYTQVGTIRLTAEVEPPYLRFSVSDTGPGLTPRQQELVFEPFSGVASDPDRPHGIGIGLPMVRRLVGLHSGRLELQSRPGRGTTFHVRFPLPNLGGTLMIYPERPSPVLLLISRAAPPTDEIRRIADLHGYEIRQLQSGADWEAALEGTTPAALLWDLECRTPGDWALIRTLRHHPLLFEAPFLLYGFRGTVTDTTQDRHDAARRVSGPVRHDETRPGEFRQDDRSDSRAYRTLMDVINTACPAQSTGPVAILSADPAFREYYMNAVEQDLAGFFPRCLTGPEDTFQLINDDPPCMVILDLEARALDPVEFVRNLRTSERLQRVPVLAAGGEIIPPDIIPALKDCSRVVTLNHGVLSSGETMELLKRLLFAEKSSTLFVNELVRRVVAYLNANFRHDITRWKLAESVNVSEDYLTRVFRREIGISPWVYLNRYRILHAKVMLRKNGWSIQTVAEQCGFHDQAYFCRVFHRITGMAPLEYRRRSADPA
jgi:signal transduction histidine kinase/DNA-binding LacI/PurR family transcriptional regulator/AraC-like DNA-binding protein